MYNLGIIVAHFFPVDNRVFEKSERKFTFQVRGGEDMGAVGIVAEYNPFHTGHAHQIARTRSALGEDVGIVCAMSGNWVQGADCAVADKWCRAELALRGGADLVLELPVPWAVASAETFARGAVSLLAATGVVDTISFGSEVGETAPLEALAECLESGAYTAALRRYLDRGLPFAACRQAAAAELVGEETAALLSRPNNNLGVEYLRALRTLEVPLRPMTVLREGTGHGEEGVVGDYASATQLRAWLRAGEEKRAAPYLPVPPAGACADMARCERAVLARLRTMAAEDWAALPDSAPAEGLPERLVRAGREAVTLEQFYDLAKTKRYTHARLRRLALWAFLGLTERDRPAAVPYLRVLGMNGAGQRLLRAMKDRAALPVLTKSAHGKNLDETARRLLELEARCTDLYGLCLPQVPPGGREWTEGPVILP